MEKKLEILTPEQLAMIPKVRSEFVTNALEYKPVNRIAARESIEWLYEAAKLKKPWTIFVDSPLAAQFAGNLLRRFTNATDSNQIGNQVWDQVWAQVGNQVRAQVRDQVGNQVGNQVRDQIRAQVRDQVWDQVGPQIGDQVRDQVRDQVWDQVRDQVWAQVGAQVGPQIGDQVRDQVRAQVRDQVWAQVRDQVWAQIGNRKLEVLDYGYVSNIWWWSWLSWVEFFVRCGLEIDDSWKKIRDLLDTQIYDTIQLAGICIVCSKPIHIERDNNNNMHSVTGPAIEWADGFKLWYLHGVSFTFEEWAEIVKPDVEAERIVAIKNMEQRRAALRVVGADAALNAMGAELVKASGRGNSLYIVRDEELFPTFPAAYFLRYSCPSTGRVYISGVDPAVGIEGDPDACMAWKHNMSREQYSQLTMES